MTQLKTLISAFRLRTLPLSISGAVVGSSYAHILGFFDVVIFVLIILTTLSFQILSNLANDYGDGVKGTDNNSRIGPERALQSGAISPKQMKNAIIINALLSAILTLLLIYIAFGVSQLFTSLIFIVLGALSIYAAITYTVGKSAYGYRALGDLMVFLFFGWLSVMGTYFLFAKDLDVMLLIPASAIGCLSAAVLNLNNMRDLETDLKSNKITLAGYLGKKSSKTYHFALILSAIVLMLIFQYSISYSKFMYLSWIAFIPLIFHLKLVFFIKNPKDFDPHLKLVALSTFVLAILFATALIIENLHSE
ncbi:MAG: 1,4-dihydroxy-2-naphthoate octaprenyltransferase [Bacteroidetes bacterium]|nr:1,4-dihydroxy-2-naphthoate octaprenyltransferase [Bacteroidota bacterium]MDA0859438.1 1,4-dihydroxy-2-naphthoate octaprenyltransferase [Bacteroidota bacterium]MDA1317975.1 1,4-dihydroxy-2-naphthoate octaprenyltransferase [Bacteroidota bacterium]